jgi:hypothetical protein
MKKAPLKVGFDLDGVILYNPARIARPIVALIKKKLLKKKKLKFYVPDSPHEKFLWRIFHWSSLFIAPGFKEVKPLADKKHIEPYIITARFDFLKHDFHKWIQRGKIDTYFKAWFHNSKNEQPHLFKERMIRELDLDVFIEDNYDIVNHLHKVFPDKEIIWVYNLLDRQVDYENRSPHLKHAIGRVKKLIDERKK